jgi:hypothetical protein
MFYCGTGQSLTISLAGAVTAAELHWYAMAIDTADVVTTGSGVTTSTSPVTMIAATKGFVRSVNVWNADTAAATVKISFVDTGGTRVFSFTLAAKSTLVLDSEHGWRVLDSAGAITTSGGSVGGDFSGPASAVDGNFVSFDGVGGKTGKDSGSKAADFATAAHLHSTYAESTALGMYGFTDRAATTIGFNDSTYVFTLTDAGSGWSYYRNSIKYTITGNKTVPLSGTPPTADTYYIYIDATDGTLTADTNAWALETGTKVPVAILCFNNALTPKYCLADERHTTKFTRQQHAYEHLTIGTRFQSGAILDDYTVSVPSPADTDNTYSIGETKIWDEDIHITCPAVAVGGPYHIEYRTGASDWAWLEQAIPFRYTTSGYIQYDNAGTMTEGANNKYYNTYLIFTNGNANAASAIIHGQAEFSTLTAAKAEKFGALTLTGLQFQEVVAVWQITWETSSAYSTTGKCCIAAEPVRITTSLVQAPAAPGLGTMSTQNADNVSITGGTIAGTTIDTLPGSKVAINGTTADTDPDDADEALIYSGDATANRKITLANLKTYFTAGVETDLSDIQDQIMYLMFRDDAGYNSNISGLMFDSFTDQTGVDDTASTGEVYDASNDLYKNDVTAGATNARGPGRLKSPKGRNLCGRAPPAEGRAARVPASALSPRAFGRCDRAAPA